MNRRNFSLMAVTGFLGLAAANASQASTNETTHNNVKNFEGFFHTTGSGSSLGGTGEFDNGSFTGDQDTITHTGNGTFHFKKDGSGVATTNGSSLVIEGNGSKYNEKVETNYEFTYKIDSNRKIQIFITESTWQGQFVYGPRSGQTFNKQILSLIEKSLPYFEGFVSKDGSSIELSTINPILIRTTIDTTNWNSVAQVVITGMK